ncbi:hypothetical protein RKD32_005954 [Streptomyces sp. SAI-195]
MPAAVGSEISAETGTRCRYRFRSPAETWTMVKEVAPCSQRSPAGSRVSTPRCRANIAAISPASPARLTAAGTGAGGAAGSAGSAAGAASSGQGSALRSSLPLAVAGKDGSSATKFGTMYPGRASAVWARSSAGVTAGAAGSVTT